MTARWRALLAAAAVTGVLAGCGSDTRGEARRSLVQQLVEGGLERPIAECVIDAFFADRSDAELKGFFDRPQLTPDEAAEFAALGAKCTPEHSTTAP